MNAIAHRDPEQALAPAQPSESSKTLAMVLEAARDPNIDAAKTEQMVNLALRLQDRELEAEFNRALVAAQLELPVITKDGIIKIPANRDKGTPERTQGRFARWEDIDRVVRPILARHGLALRFDIGNAEQSAVTVTPILAHTNGYTLRGQAMKLPRDSSGAKNEVQGTGSAVQYGKRYSACALLNIVTEGVDDDGNMGEVVVTLPYEREQLTLSEAAKAAEAGSYQEWFDQASPKDRAFMLTTARATHDEYGGKVPTGLPAPAPAAKPDQVSNQNATDERPGASRSAAPEKRQTPAQWVKAFKARVDQISTLDALDEYWDGKNEALARLKAEEPTLWQEAHEHISNKREALAEGRLV